MSMAVSNRSTNEHISHLHNNDVASTSTTNYSHHDASAALQQSPDELTFWKDDLFYLQQRAPKALAVLCNVHVPNKPKQYGAEYHGQIERSKAAQLLQGIGDGGYLVRSSTRNKGSETLAILYAGNVKNFVLFYDEETQEHWVGQKRFSSVHELVGDGLINFYFEQYDVEQVIKDAQARSEKESPYGQFANRSNTAKRVGSTASYSRHQHNRKKSQHGIYSPQPVRSSFQQPYAPGVTDNTNLRRSVDSIGNYSPRSVSSQPHPSPPIPPRHYGVSEINSVVDSFNSQSLDKNSHNSESDVSSNHSEQDFQLKKHDFKVHTFKIKFCDLCGHFLFGLSSQGMRCTACAVGVHKHCVESMNHSCCIPKREIVKRLFGVDLVTRCMAHQCSIPSLVVDCIREVETRGVTVEGLYRIPGAHDVMEQLKAQYDVKGSADLSPSAVEDICAVAGLLKLYFRQLPIPLITHQAYKDLHDTIQRSNVDSERMRGVVRIVAELPPQHYDTLKYVIKHLNRVAQSAHVNRMTARNLATVFAPTLMRSPQSFTTLPGLQPPGNPISVNWKGAVSGSLATTTSPLLDGMTNELSATTNQFQMDACIMDILISRCDSIFDQ